MWSFMKLPLNESHLMVYVVAERAMSSRRNINKTYATVLFYD